MNNRSATPKRSVASRSGSVRALGHWLARSVAVLVMATGTVAAVSTQAHAAGGYTAGGGPWNVRSCASTECSIVGQMPNGPIPDLVCQVYGQRVIIGSYVTSVWNKVITPWPASAAGYMTNAGINETPAEGFDPNLPRCGGAPGGSAYFRPYDPWPLDPRNVDADADFIVKRSEWSLGGCSVIYGGNYPDVIDGKRVTTLSGWSLGRLGPTYAMMYNLPRVMESINSIVLYDPGGYDDYFGDDSCDPEFPQASLYADWLSADPGNRLLILAGWVTRDVENPSPSGHHHRGIQEALFTDIRGTSLAQQVLVCNYNDLGHREVLNHFTGIVGDGPQSSCPTKPGVTLDAEWHP